MTFKEIVEEAEKHLSSFAQNYYTYKIAHEKQQASYKNKTESTMQMRDFSQKFNNYLFNLLTHTENKKTHLLYKQRLNRSKIGKYINLLQVSITPHRILYNNPFEAIEAYLLDHPELAKEEPMPETLSRTSFGFYGDSYEVNGFMCIITGHGKSKAIRSIDYCNDNSIDFNYITLTDDSVCTNNQRISFFINMVWSEEINPEHIKCVSPEEYVKYARGNFKTSDMSNEEVELLIYECSKRGIKFLLVPWYDTHEARIRALEQFFSNKTINCVKP